METRFVRHGDVFRARRDAPGDVLVVEESESTHRFSVARLADGGLAIRTESGMERAEAARAGDTVWVRWRGHTYVLDVERGRRRGGRAASGGLSSPMPGQVQKILVAVGDAVTENQPLLVVEAMKMQLEIKAAGAGRVARILAAEGEPVQAGTPLVQLEEEAS